MVSGLATVPGWVAGVFCSTSVNTPPAWFHDACRGLFVRVGTSHPLVVAVDSAGRPAWGSLGATSSDCYHARRVQLASPRRNGP